MIVGEGRAEIGLVHKAPSSYMGPPFTTHMLTYAVYWTLSHFLLQ